MLSFFLLFIYIRVPEIDMTELETYFSATDPNPDKAANIKAPAAKKPEKVQLVNELPLS